MCQPSSELLRCVTLTYLIKTQNSSVHITDFNFFACGLWGNSLLLENKIFAALILVNFIGLKLNTQQRFRNNMFEQLMTKIFKCCLSSLTLNESCVVG